MPSDKGGRRWSKKMEAAKRQYRDEHWEQDLQKAYDAGKRMAEGIIPRTNEPVE